MSQLPKPILYEESERLDPQLGFKYNQFFKSDNNIILHSHDYYEIIFLSNEGCHHFVNGKEYALPKRTLMFIRPSDCHDFLNPEFKQIEIIQHKNIKKKIKSN